MAGGDLSLTAGNDLRMVASEAQAGDEAYLFAGNDVELLAANDQDYYLYEKEEDGGLFGSSSYQRDEVNDLRAVGSQVESGGDLTVVSGGDQTYQGARLESGDDLTLASLGDIRFEAASDVHTESHEESSGNFAWQSSKGEGRTDETLRQSELIARNDIRIAARSGINVLYAGRNDETIDQAMDRAVASNPELAWLRDLQARDDVTWKALEEVHDAWSYSQSGLSPLAANILAAVAAYYTAGAASGLIGSMAGASAGSGTAMAAAGGNAVAGWANASLSGIAGGAVGGAAGAVSQGYDWQEPALNGAITGGLVNYMAGGTYFNNPVNSVEKISRDLAAGALNSLGKTAYRQGMNHFFGKVQSEFAEEIGLTSEQLNWVLLSGTIAGASLDSVGTRFKLADEDFILSGDIGDRGVSDRGIVGLPFDAIDILLGYQGLPDSSVQAQLASQGLGGVSTGHSLGTLTNIYLMENGLIDKAYLFSVPLGVVAPSNTTVTDGTFDMVNGGWAGKLFNWDAIMVPLMPWEHGYTEHYKRFIETNPKLYQ